jgi:hypothetical protein
MTWIVTLWVSAKKAGIMSADDDLSDVIPIGVTIGITDGVNEMWMGRRICEIQGYGENGWTADQMLDYFTDLCRVYDTWCDSKAPWIMPDDWQQLVLPPDVRHTGYNRCHELRDFVAKAYECYDLGMSDLLRHLGVEPTMWMQSLQGSQYRGLTLTYEQVNQVEDWNLQIVPPTQVKEMMASLGVSRKTFDTLSEPFRKRRIKVHGEDALKVDRAPELLRQLVLAGEHKTDVILQMVYDATGVKYGKSRASKIRTDARDGIVRQRKKRIY